MSLENFWLPEQVPPQVSEDASHTIAQRLEADGVDDLVVEGYRKLRLYHQPFLDYLLEFGDKLNKQYHEQPWPRLALQFGAALAVVAYSETGFYQEIDNDTVTVGAFAADLTGIPDAYLGSVQSDTTLDKLVYNAAEQRARRIDDTDKGHIAQVALIGAGCTRHFMQQAMAA